MNIQFFKSIKILSKKLFIILLAMIALCLAAVVVFSLIQKVEAGNTIIVHYTIRMANGKVYYTTFEGKPLQETVGQGKFIPGFEEALIGMHIGQAKTVTISSEKAYGEYDPDLVGTVGRNTLAEGVQPEIGKLMWAELKDGTPTLATITEFTESTVTLDANHPLAGMDLTLEFQLLGIDDHGALGSLTNVRVLTWAFLALGVLIIGLALFTIIKRGGFHWLRAHRLDATSALRRRQVGLRLRQVAWYWILPVVVGILFLGYALVSVLFGGKAQIGDIVSVLYTLRLEDGSLYNATPEGEPLQLTLGDGALIPGVEEALLGMRAGETKTVTILPEKAYGPHRPELVFEYDRSELPEGSQPEVGQQVKTTLEDGTALTMIVSDVTETTVTMDANPPLAGKKLTFEVELVGIGGILSPGFLTNRIVSVGVPVVLILFISGFGFFYIRRYRKLQPFMRKPIVGR